MNTFLASVSSVLFWTHESKLREAILQAKLLFNDIDLLGCPHATLLGATNKYACGWLLV